jgi:hypothetical protein
MKTPSTTTISRRIIKLKIVTMPKPAFELHLQYPHEAHDAAEADNEDCHYCPHERFRLRFCYFGYPNTFCSA